MWVAGQKLAQHASPRHCLFYFPLSVDGHGLFSSFLFRPRQDLNSLDYIFHNCFVRVSRWWSFWWSKFIRFVHNGEKREEIFTGDTVKYRRMKSRVALVLDIYDVMMTRNTTLSLSIYTLMFFSGSYIDWERRSSQSNQTGLYYIWRGRRDDDDVNAANQTPSEKNNSQRKRKTKENKAKMMR
jgi:hypothetical protein